MSKNLSAIYYQENKEVYRKKAPERYQNLTKDRKKSNYWVVKLQKSLRR